MTAPVQLPDFDDTGSDVSVAGCRLVRLLEDGGTARTYLARYLESSTVLVKLFDSDLVGDSAHAVDTYRWECEALLGLRHRALPQNVCFGRSEALGCDYLVQELVPGIRIASLRRALRRAFTPAEAADLLLPIADALVGCHQEGLVHGHLTATHVLLEPRAPVPLSRLVGLRPRLLSDVADAGDTRALALLAYAMTAVPGGAVASLPEILAGAPNVRASHDDRWNALILDGLRTSGEERMLQIRDALSDVLKNQTCVHRESASLSRALPPLDAALEEIMTRPVRLPVVPQAPEDDDTGPTTLWVSPDAPLEEVEAEWAESLPGATPAVPADRRVRPLYNAGTYEHDPYMRPEEAPTRPHLRVAPPPDDDVSAPLERTAGPESSEPPEPLSKTQKLDPHMLENLKNVSEPSRESLVTTVPRPVTPAPTPSRTPAPGMDPGAILRTPLSRDERSSMLVWMGAFAFGLIGAATAVFLLA